MAEGKPIRVAREAGLTASPRPGGAGPRGQRPAPLRPQELSEHRERRVRLGSYLLGFCLLLGLAWLGLYIAAAFPPNGVPSTVFGNVLDYTSDAPVVNATVTLENTTLSTTTDSTGNFTLPSVPSGAVHVRIDAEGYRNTTFALFILPQTGSAPSLYNGFHLLVQRGDGPNFEDAVGARTASVEACLAIFGVGVALNALGFMASRTRRRYGHAVLGSVGAFLSVGFYLGPLLGLVAYILLRGARESFADRRSLFSPGTGPALYAEDDEDEDDDEGAGGDDEEGGAAADEDGDEGDLEQGAADKGEPPKSEGDKPEAPKGGSP